MKETPKFFPNWDDDNHCLQAAVMMAFAYKKIDITWDEVNELTEYNSKYWTSASFGALALIKKIKNIVVYTDLDYRRFSEEGEDYFKEYAAPDWFIEQKKYSSPKFKKEAWVAGEFLKQGGVVKDENLTIEKVDNILDKNVFIALLNLQTLGEADEPLGHFVFVFNKDEGDYVFHDPGLPPQKNNKAKKKLFLQALGSLIVIPKNSK